MVGGPAGVGSSLLFAHLRHGGARAADIVNTRAIVSVAWVTGRSAWDRPDHVGVRPAPAINATAVTIMTVYVTETLYLDVMWAGIALGVAAAIEVPALISMGRLSDRYSHLGVLATIGLLLFQQMIPRPSLSTGRVTARRRSGPATPSAAGRPGRQRPSE